MSGAIPPELGNLANLTELIIVSTQLSGAIPPELGNLSNLEALGLSGNQLSGAIPPELGNLSNLEWLNLGGNQLSGAIPPELGNLSNLEGLDLTVNQLSGAIPPELGNLSNLEWLNLGGNQLSGAIPPELGNLSNLEALGLSVNQLSGAIPPELGNLSNLEWLTLGGNQLSGCESFILPNGSVGCGEQSVDTAPAQCASADLECALAHKFAPVLSFHLDEKYLPRGVERFVDLAKLDKQVRLLPDTTILARDEITSSNIQILAEYSGEEHAEYYLDAPDEIADAAEIDYQPEVYATIRGPYGGKLYLQYHLFYYFDELREGCRSQRDSDDDFPTLREEVCSEHEADWELIQMEFDADSVEDIVNQSLYPNAIAYSQHGWVARGDVDGEGPIVVYVAYGKHANYPSDVPKHFRGDGAWVVGWEDAIPESLDRLPDSLDPYRDLIAEGFDLLPPRLSDSADPCPSIAGRFLGCTYEYALTMIDDDTPWVAFNGRWGDNHVEGPDKPRAWNEPHLWQFDDICAELPDSLSDLIATFDGCSAP